MDCPRCGATAVLTPECPACGVLVSKARVSRSRPQRTAPEPAPPPPWRSLVAPGLGLVLVVGAAVWHLRQPPASAIRERPGAEDAAEAAQPAGDGLGAGAAGIGLPDLSAPAPVSIVPPPPLVLDASAAANDQIAADQAAGDRLTARLEARAPVSAEDVRTAEGLFARYPAAARHLLEATLLSAAAAERDARRFDAALSLVERAVAIAPRSPVSQGALVDVRLAMGDWSGAEQAGRALLAMAPGDTHGARGLAQALLRQDRTREAVELLSAFLDAHPDETTRALLARIQREQAPEASLAEAKLAHFHVRFDGDAHEEVGREILRLLERHYATLARTFDYQPQQPIPVILLARDSYYTATGAPAWSGGQYDSFDGRVRIPIGGLSASLAPEIDETLVHEVTHSFVADISRGAAPRELHEGLAQFMEGKRIAALDPERLRALADGRLGGVSGFYFGALFFVEDLVAQRGQGGINDVLRALSATGVDEAFRGVYGRDLAALERQARDKLRQRHGS